MKIPVADSIALLHTAHYAVLATQASQFPGYPYATPVPLVVDGNRRPLLLISALAEHTKNLLADSRASLAVTEPGADNVQNAARLTLVGDFRRIEASEALARRYLRYLPEAEQYLALDFMFFRLERLGARHIGGVGRMGWLAPEEWDDQPVLPESEEEALIAEFSAALPTSYRLLGIDPWGLDLATAAGRKRHTFPAALAGEALRAALPGQLVAATV